MAAISKSNHDLIAKLVPGGVHSLAHVDDDELLRNTRRLVAKSNQLFAALLLHLAEVETRGLHRKRLCASLTRPSWERFASSFEPPVRDLRPGERPREWANDDAVADEVMGTPRVGSALAPDEASPTSEPELLPAAPAELPPITGPQQYQMQFTTSEEHVKLVERAKALLARERPGLALGEVHLEAMKLLVAALEKRKFAVTDRPRKPACTSQAIEEAAKSADSSAQAAREPRQSALTPRQRGRYCAT